MPRFPYFVDFPISVIYESGFISNPEDEAMLRAPENQRTIAESQYEALLETTKDVFGLDLSGREPRKVKKPPEDLYTLLKLSRIAIFYVAGPKSIKPLPSSTSWRKDSDGRIPPPSPSTGA